MNITQFVQGEATSISKMSKAKLVLHYFDFPFWRAEVCRLALHLGKVSYKSKQFFCLISESNEYHYFLQVEFEDKKIKDFAEFKASGIAPLGQAPILEVIMRVFCDSDS